MSAKKFLIVCYDEDLLCNYITNFSDSIKEYAYIKHFPEEDDKKEHFHFYVEFYNPKNRKPIANALNINEILIQSCRNKRLTFQYFLHRDLPQKKQYDLTDIITNIDINILFCLIESNVETEEDYFKQQIDYIDNGYKLTDLIRLSIEDKNLSQLRRYWHIIKYFYDNVERF